MNTITPVSRSRHSNKRWQRFSSYSFAAGDAVAPITVDEVARACSVMPVGFIQQDDGSYRLVAVQGVKAGQNLWVGPDGRWCGGYVPAIYRAYPFTLAGTEDNRKVLCIRESDQTTSETLGVPFFNEDGTLAKAVQDILEFLKLIEAGTQRTLAICALLQAKSLIRPWPITLKTGEQEQKIQGLYCIDEAALDTLSPEAFQVLHKAGALAVVYCQMLSMQHLRLFATRIEGQRNASAAENTEDLNLEFMRDDTLRFN